MAASIVRVLLVLGLGCSNAKGDFFTKDPLDVTVPVGGTAHFWCSTEDDFTCTNMNWVYSNSLREGHPYGAIGTCLTPRIPNASDSSRFSFTFDGDNSRYSLQITEVTESDSGRYGCWVVKAETQDFGLISEYSDIGILTVTPRLVVPTCRTRPEIASPNQELYLICEVPQDAEEESVRLTWYFERTTFRRTLQIQRGSSFSQPHQLLESDNYGRFTCFAGADDIGGPSCTLVPLQIPTNVTLRFDSSDIVDDLDSGTTTATFDCDAEAVPPATSYQWRVMEYDATTNMWKRVELGDSHRITNGNRTLEISVTEMDWDSLSVTCTASNDIGLSETSEPTMIQRCSSGALVTDTRHCDSIQTTATLPSGVLTVTDTDARTRGGDTKPINMGPGIIVGIVVGVVLLIIIALFLGFLILRSRRSKKAAGNGVRPGPGVSYNTSGDIVDVGHQIDTSKANAKMTEAEACVHANACASAFDESNERWELDQDKVMSSEKPARKIDGGFAGQEYASIGEASGRQTADATRQDGDVYASIGEEKVNGVSQSLNNTAAPRDNLSGYESVEQKSIHVPSAYELVDLNTSTIQSSSNSTRDTSDAGLPPSKKICVVSPTTHRNAGSEGDQVLYAMPDKSHKHKSEHENSDSKKTPVLFHKSVKSAGNGAQADVLYALPDKKSQQSIQKFNSVPDGSEKPTVSETPSQPSDSSEVLYAMPDKSRSKPGITRSLSSDAVLDFDTTAKSGSLDGTQSLKIKSRNNTSPRKPQRTPSSRLAGSRVLRNKKDVSKLARSSSADILDKEEDFSALYAKPDKSGTVSSKVKEPELSASAPVYATPDKGQKIPSQNKQKNAATSNNNEPVYAMAE